MAKAKTKRPQFTATAEHNLGVALANASEALYKVNDVQISKLPILGSMIRALEGDMPRVAARLTALERASVKDGWPRSVDGSAPTLLNDPWTAATALSQEQLARMIQSLQRVYWKKRLATEK